MTGGHFQSDNQKDWYYYTANGEKLTGWQNVDGVILYFDKDGKQVKGQEREIGGKYYRFDENDGSLLTNQWHHTSIFNGYRTEPQYTTYTNYLGEDGAAFIGWHTIDSKRYYFKPDGLLAKNDTVTIDGKIYLLITKDNWSRTNMALLKLLQCSMQTLLPTVPMLTAKS